MDTESQYTLFWDEKGKKHHPEIPNFGHHIKGQTLTQLYEQYFLQPEGLQEQITQELNEFETKMDFPFIPGVVDFMKELREKGVKMAIVTSSNDKKMAHVYRACPELKEMFDLILTSDMFTRSKPDPDCFLTAAEKLGFTPDECVVYEDSLHGLQAARNACMMVIGLATTLPVERIAPLADEVWTDFNDHWQ
jgi:HAD superfamily hydrolase (TIGR01509 family)